MTWSASWALWAQRRPVIGAVLAVDALALALVVASPWWGTVTRADLVEFAVLAGVAVVNVEAGRGIERLREVRAEGAPYVNLQSVWVFAGLLVLPPSLLASLVVASFTHLWFRATRRISPHRWVYSTAAVLLASATAGAILAGTVGYPGLPGGGPSSLTAIVAAGLAYWLVQYALVVGALLLADPDAAARTALGDGGEQLVTAATIGLGVAMAVLLAFRPWLVVVPTATVLALHRGLLIHQLQAAARTDGKTGLANSGYWFEIARKELARSQRRDGALGVLVVDLDHFKQVNDDHGHLTGDHVLREVARALRREVRVDDLVGRFGGEEFAVLLPGVEGEGELLRIAERIRRHVAGLDIAVPDGLDRTGPGAVVRDLTASVGAAYHPVHGRSVDRLVLAADTACYAAKTAGRDRVHLARADDPVPPTSIVPAALTATAEEEVA